MCSSAWGRVHNNEKRHANIFNELKILSWDPIGYDPLGDTKFLMKSLDGMLNKVTVQFTRLYILWSSVYVEKIVNNKLFLVSAQSTYTQ